MASATNLANEVFLSYLATEVWFFCRAFNDGPSVADGKYVINRGSNGNYDADIPIANTIVCRRALLLPLLKIPQWGGSRRFKCHGFAAYL